MIEELDFESINNLCEAASRSKSKQAILFNQLCADSEVWRSKFRYTFPSYFEGMDRDAANFWRDSYESFGEKVIEYEDMLEVAVFSRNISEIKDLLKRGVDPRLIMVSESWHDRIESVEALLRAGVEPDIKDNNGQTALMLAAYAGNTEVVETLLKAGADINYMSPQNVTILEAAFVGYRKGLTDNPDTILKIIEYNPSRDVMLGFSKSLEEFRNDIDDKDYRKLRSVVDALL